MNLRQTLRRAWGLIGPYWVSDDRWPARGLLLAVIALTLGMVYLTVLLNQWNNAFYGALQDKNLTAFRAQLFRVTYLIGIFILLAVYQVYLNQMLEIRWRRWLTDRYLRAWLSDDVYYRMQLTGRETDNPDQRIAEDVQQLATHTLGLFTGGIRATVTLVTFVAILWSLSGKFTVTVGDVSLDVPGYMVWVAVFYAVFGTWLTDLLGRPLVRLNFDRQRYEADFRFSLVRFRENTEGVALYRGETDEFRTFRQRFEDVVANWWGIMRRQKRMTYFTSGYGLGAWIVPSIVAAPRYFRGELGLGGLMQTAQAFQQVQDALSFFVQSYKEIAAWRAVVERLAGFELALQQAHADVGGIDLRPTAAGSPRLFVDGVDLHRPDGQPLITRIDLSLGPGDTVLLGGPSGSGKSTLIRAMAGIWPFGRGEIRVPPDSRMLFLPQKPYLPIGPLREVVTYPTPAGGVDDKMLREALDAVGLPQLASRLDERAHWARELSPGEQQRIAFARALVQRPDWLFLDEATSALDEATEARLYRLIRERLPQAMMFSVGHRATLGGFHTRRLQVQGGGNGVPASIVELPPTRERAPAPPGAREAGRA
ncbi:MAG TPA: ABC transporter ATP-binding protein/permease [Methylomirabilota bacterium]|nr:ABC transporter ATP-binding protein/permease [Methylomirabilota bacterium]